MPKVFANPAAPDLAKEGKTTYLVPVGPGTMFPGPEGIHLAKDVPDGTSNTVLAVGADVKHAVVWTKPEDLPFDADDPFKGLGKDDRRGFAVLMADGSVRFVSVKVSKETLRAVFTRDGGEVLGDDW